MNDPGPDPDRDAGQHWPRLREVNLSGLLHITLAGTKVFPAHVRVNYNV